MGIEQNNGLGGVSASYGRRVTHDSGFNSGISYDDRVYLGSDGLLVGPDGAAPDYPVGAARDYTIGAFYFPGWSTPGAGPFAADPWSVIPDNRKPLIGAFDESLQEVADYNLKLARDYGLKFLAYDWYATIGAGGQCVPMLEHAINNHRASSVAKKPAFCVTFVCQTNAPQFTPETWPAIYKVWVDEYFSDNNYQKKDGAPLVFIFDAATFNGCMGGAAGSAAALEGARAYAKSKGFEGIHFVGLQSDSTNYWMGTAEDMGFDGMSAYTVFFKYENYGDTPGPAPTTYQHLSDAIYSETAGGLHGWWGHQGFASPPAFPAPTLPALGWADRSFTSMIAPIASGFDERPWQASALHGIPSDAEFEAHLIKARAAIDAHRHKTGGFGVITAWNEFGEGQYLMPTKATGYGRLAAIRRVFG